MEPTLERDGGDDGGGASREGAAMTRGAGSGLLLSQVSGLGTEEEGEGHMKEGERERFSRSFFFTSLGF